jgi:endonuclease-3 related protein
MDRARQRLLEEIFATLLEALGRQHWWPAETRLEVIVGAILTQNTAWRNVVRAINALKEEGLLSVAELDRIPEEELAVLIRPAGYFRQKGRAVKRFAAHVKEVWQGGLERFLAQEQQALRRELLGLYGIGPETADSILLYAAEKPAFVVDLYTRRILSRHGWVPENVAYAALQHFFTSCLPPVVPFYQEFHALLVRLGHLYCRPRPRCSACPLGHCPRPTPGTPLAPPSAWPSSF